MEITEAMRSFTGTTAITVVFLLAACTLVAFNRTVSRQERRAFLVCLATLVCVTLADWFSSITNGQLPEVSSVHAVLAALVFAVAPALPVMISHTVSPTRNPRWIVILVVANAIFEFESIVGGYVFWVDAANLYHRGPLYPVYIAVYTVSSLYLIVQTIRAARAYQSVHFAVVLGILVCMFTGVIIQLVDSAMHTTWPAVAMTVVLYFQFYSDMVLRTDALTTLLNRRSFEDAMAKPSLPCVIAVIDVDEFKNVNDTYGHAYGDVCLARAAKMIRQSFGHAGLCYRTGGDEFAVIMTKHLDDASTFATDLAKWVDEARAADERMPGLSVGYALASEGGLNANEALEAADQQMYQSKRDAKKTLGPSYD